MTVRRADIVAAVRSLGVRPNNLLIAHSSYKSFGASGVEGGPRAVAEALVGAMSPGGSVFMPAFNYGRDVFDSATAPSYDGVITETFRTLPGAVRSLHPTHSLAGLGPEAASILKGHDQAQPFGNGSPIWRLWEQNAWVLLIGVGQFANSMAHVAEELLAMPYLDRTRTARVRRGNGAVEEVVVRRPGCSDAWDRVLAPALRSRTAETLVGESRLQLMQARQVVDVTVELLRGNPGALLCDSAECEACATARSMLG